MRSSCLEHLDWLAELYALYDARETERSWRRCGSAEVCLDETVYRSSGDAFEQEWLSVHPPLIRKQHAFKE